MPFHVFIHEAMNTEFEFRIRHAKPDYARQAAQAAFAEVDRLEALLSRFVEGSDVWRINHAKNGEHVTISEECHACLMHAVEMAHVTQGAFNVTIGDVADLAKKKGPTKLAAKKLRGALQRSAQAVVSLSPDSLEVRVERRGISIDLGAVGKGYAIDRARVLLGQWEIKHALLSAGGSSVLAFGNEISRRGTAHAPAKPAGWIVNVAGGTQSTPLALHECGFGSSGTTVLGRHIIDPRRAAQSYTYVRTWALAPSAAVADALSTACMTMMPDEIVLALQELGKGHSVITEDTNGRLHMGRRSGVWTLIRSTHSLSWPTIA